MKKIVDRLYRRFGKRTVRGAGAVIALIIIIIVAINATNNNSPAAEQKQTPTVPVSAIRDIQTGSSLTLIGSVEAVDEVRLETEASGRITGVNVTLGQQVSAGQTIAQIENASEYASLLQAEGAYEAAVAAARSSDVSLVNAQSDAVTTYRDAYSTANNIVLNTIDKLFSNPKSTTPGVRLGGIGTSYLNDERYAFNTMLNEWQRESITLSPNDNLRAALSEARENVVRVQRMIDTFIPLLASANVQNSAFTETELNTYRSNFATADASITAQLSAIDSTIDILARAELSGSGGTVSAADAQVKQALGALRAAEANYAKTVIRTPIAGTVNSLSVKSGDYVNTFTPVAIIANNNALEITTYVGSTDRERIAIGDEVMIEGTYTGIVTEIAPAVDPVTKKVEVKIQSETDEIENGDTVSISFRTQGEIGTESMGPVMVPLTAVKFNAENGTVFTIENDTLVAHEVVVGQVSGSFIEIIEGVTRDTVIVIDARGLNSGQHVEAISN